MEAPNKQAGQAKTMKREVAVCGLFFWAVIVGRIVWAVQTEDISAYVDVLTVITWPVWAYAAGAFGLDAWQKSRRGFHRDAGEREMEGYE